MASLQKSLSTSSCDSLKSDMQMDGTLDPRPKRGPDIKIIIQSLKLAPILEQPKIECRAVACNPFKMFKSSIQYANDSGSMDSSFEHKEIYTEQIKSKVPQRRKMPCVEEFRQVLQENEQIIRKDKSERNETPSKLPFSNRKNLPTTPTVSNDSFGTDIKTPKFCEKLFDLLPLSKKMPASSTPFRPKPNNEMNNNCEKELNQMIPSVDVKAMIKSYSLTRVACRQMAASRKRECVSSDLSPNSPIFKRGHLFSSSFHGRSNESPIISSTESSPVLPRKNTVNSRIAQFLGITKVNTESDLTQTCNNLSRMLEQSGQTADDLGCTPLLTTDNVDVHTKMNDETNDCDETIIGGNKFEFSFICEPSTSDTDEDIELEYFPSTDCRKKLPFIPFSKGSMPPTKLCDNFNSSPFRRTISDPALIRLATNNNNPSNCATENTVSGLYIKTCIFRVRPIELIMFVE